MNQGKTFPLSPAEYKALIKNKGWTICAIAKYWEKTPEWMSKIAANPERGLHWDDALRGLPDLSAPAKHK
jgi:hypothetical protein